MSEFTDYEREHALREAAMIHAENEYFVARPQLEGDHNRRIFDAGFQRGYDQLRARNAELERQLADRVPRSRYNAANADYEELKTQLAAVQENANRQINALERKLANERDLKESAQAYGQDMLKQAKAAILRAEQAEQRIAESRRQKPIYQQWIECGGWEDTEKEEYEAVPDYDRRIIYAAPIIPPDVEEAVKAEREACAPYMRHRNDEHVFCESLKSEDSPCTCGLDAIRARSGK